ncbi:hypothetical protein QNA25_23380, partial [Rhodococcus ruber]|nr:hypothetical protein [Rhodococcus ruber]
FSYIHAGHFKYQSSQTRSYTLRAHIHARDGRKLHLQATIENDHAHVITTATALFLTVDVNHFLTHNTPPHTDNTP